MSYKEIPGKGVDNDPRDPKDTIPIRFEIAEDNVPVGAGMPITLELCKKIVADYYIQQMNVFNILSNSDNEEVRAWANPEKEVVSGVYGKETILHILEQSGCEGIRYMNCVYGGEKSIVLFGVDKNGEPIGGRDKFLDEQPDRNLVIYEVKGGSKTLSDVLEMFDNPNRMDNILDSII